MLETALLGGTRRAAQSLEAPVHLDRVAVDRHRVLAPGSQRLGHGDGDARLADGSGAEQGQDPHAAGSSGR